MLAAKTKLWLILTLHIGVHVKGGGGQLFQVAQIGVGWVKEYGSNEPSSMGGFSDISARQYFEKVDFIMPELLSNRTMPHPLSARAGWQLYAVWETV